MAERSDSHPTVPPLPSQEWLTIGDVATRTGLAVSAIRYYEQEGLVHPVRTHGKQRRYRRADVRRLSFIIIAQQLGFSLSDIRTRLEALPDGRTPTRRDWQRISRAFRDDIEEQIEILKRTAARLDGCIGCGCLSLKHCRLYNPEDRAAARGPGARWLLGDPDD
ncbi:MAG: redox-sensitive transcriptional activator SoxR [Pseudomonadota bacterium]